MPRQAFFAPELPQPSDLLWFGENKNKALAILAYRDIKLKVLDDHNTSLQTIVPVSVSGGGFDFNLFAVWANNPDDPEGQYVEQVWKAVNHYEHLFANTHTILTGDFNSNTIWDRKYRIGNHSTVVEFLEARRIHSAYHIHYNQLQGQEEHPTFYLYRHKNKPYHLDYCFVSEELRRRIETVEIGEHAYWAQYSDHVPVMVEFADR